MLLWVDRLRVFTAGLASCVCRLLHNLLSRPIVKILSILGWHRLWRRAMAVICWACGEQIVILWDVLESGIYATTFLRT